MIEGDQTKSNTKEERVILELQTCIPAINDIFYIHRPIGKGTFSTVFLATLKRHTETDQKLFAIKYLVPTSHPRRIEQELKCLLDMGGVDNVAGVDLCLRNNDHVALVMKYIRNDSFTKYFSNLDAWELQNYMRNLLIALKRVHSFGIIHRDVKPSNFLHDRKFQKFLLIDFGLAENVKINKECQNTAILDKSSRCEQSKASEIEGNRNYSKGCKDVKHYLCVQQSERNQQTQSLDENVQSCLTRFPPTFNVIRQPKNSLKSFPFPSLLTNNNKSPEIYCSVNECQRRSFKNHTNYTSSRSNSVACCCFQKPMVCNLCIMMKGFKASRAGTSGYRAPEVILKYVNQSTAVDIWAVGVIMISILSSSYPFFDAPNDFDALAQMVAIFGDEIISKTALSLSRHVCISRKTKPLHLRKLCISLRHRSLKEEGSNEEDENKSSKICENCQQRKKECLCDDSGLNVNFMKDIYPDSAYDLLSKLLTINPEHRISAADALEHPFFDENL